MTNRERVLSVLKGDIPDMVPFTIYDWKIPWGHDKRKLRERGVVMMERFPGWRVEYPNCELKTICWIEGGIRYERELVKTPQGEITSLFLYDQTTGVRRQSEFWVKREQDYEPLMYVVGDAVYYSAYDEISAAKTALGEDGFVWMWIGYTPLEEIMLRLAGIERFCYDLTDQPDLVWALYDALRERDRKKYSLIAQAPVEMIQYSSNPIAAVLGRDLYVNKVLPCQEECAEIVHGAGKILSTHVDGDNAIWATDLARCSVDVIEAFTPHPDTDMTMAEGHKLFRNKIIWANFPSSMHIRSVEKIRQTTRDILKGVFPGDRFLLGITEDIPEWCWRTSMNAILDVLEEYGVFSEGKLAKLMK